MTITPEEDHAATKLERAISRRFEVGDLVRYKSVLLRVVCWYYLHSVQTRLKVQVLEDPHPPESYDLDLNELLLKAALLSKPGEHPVILRVTPSWVTFERAGS